ncbi:MAG: hypothetical protein AABX14_02765 [Candidatus Aenigmatarchaeota archaeon]
MNVFGSYDMLIDQPENLVFARGFTGVGFGYQGVPLDVLVPFLAGAETDYCMLLVDEFYRFNWCDEGIITSGLEQIQRSLTAMSFAYASRPKILVASGFMGSNDYMHVLDDVEEQVNEKDLRSALMSTVPERRRNSYNPLRYPLNEIACTYFLRKYFDRDAKLGPKKEIPYDNIMRCLGADIAFAYFIDAYALGTRNPETVVHYVPTDRGSLGSNGQRIFLGDNDSQVNSKTLSGPDEASRYLLTLSSVAGIRLGKQRLEKGEIEALHGKKLRKTAKQFVIENIMKPYREAAGAMA